MVYVRIWGVWVRKGVFMFVCCICKNKDYVFFIFKFCINGVLYMVGYFFIYVWEIKRNKMCFGFLFYYKKF